MVAPAERLAAIAARADAPDPAGWLDTRDLVAFAQAVLALCDAADAVPLMEEQGIVYADDVRRLADEHLGGAP